MILRPVVGVGYGAARANARRDAFSRPPAQSNADGLDDWTGCCLCRRRTGRCRPGRPRPGHHRICTEFHAEFDFPQFSGYVLPTLQVGKPVTAKETELAVATRQAFSVSILRQSRVTYYMVSCLTTVLVRTLTMLLTPNLDVFIPRQSIMVLGELDIRGSRDDPIAMSLDKSQ